MVINFENIPMYSIFLILSLFINGVIVFYFGKMQNLDKNTILCSLSFESLGIICGAKILNIFQTNGDSFFYAGFSSYGGVIGGIIMLILFSKVYKIELRKLLNVYISILPLLYSISKLGCFFSGCCYGIKYNGFGKIVYKSATQAPLNIGLFPIQLVESIVNLMIFIFITLNYKKNKDNNSSIINVFVFCGLSKFLLEFLRYSWNGMITSTQVISLFFIILGLLLKYKWRKNEK